MKIFAYLCTRVEEITHNLYTFFEIFEYLIVIIKIFY